MGAVLNKRFVRLRCKEDDCLGEWKPVYGERIKLYHIWDSLTAKLVAHDVVDDAGVTHREAV